MLPLALQAAEPCPFDHQRLTYAGNTLEQARCLLRPVRPYGELDAPSDALPAPLARYFVIHDTSTALGIAPFPDDIDQPTWPHNDLGVWIQGATSRAHVFISRTTKFEMQDTLLRRKGLFLHIELVSPRRNDATGPQPNDALAPPGGFPVVQYDRLALVYVAASLRRGEWLIPAFHAVLDAGRIGGHDDPQNFSLSAFTHSLVRLIDAIVNTATAGAQQSPVASTLIPE